MLTLAKDMYNKGVYKKEVGKMKKKSLAETHPELAKQWHPTQNGDLSPQNVTKGSHHKVWWRCEKGHEWEAIIGKRSDHPTCPICSNKVLLVGFNDLKTKFPELAKQWHPTKNGVLTAQDVLYGSTKKVWWKGVCGHEWEAILAQRTKNKTNCPYCTNSSVLTGFNDLAFKRPLLVPYWHPTKNHPHTPETTMFQSNQLIWWKSTECNHEWCDYLRNIKDTPICPYCSFKKVLPGFNDLATTHPKLAKEWSNKNTKKPKETTKIKSDKVWWICEHDHEWEAIIRNRVAGSGCPYCDGKKAIKGKTDLRTTHPDIIPEWDFKKNKISPDEVSHGSSKKVWWLCDNGHEWEAIIHSRSKGTGCPYCSGNRVIIGETDLATTHPHLAKEWHPKNNGKLTTQDVSYGSNKKVWWLGHCGHEWEASLNERSSGNGCPYCSGQRILKNFNDLTTTHPLLVLEWDFERNYPLKPNDYSKGSSKKVWWKCPKAHEYQSAIKERTQGCGCPICSGKRVVQGINDLDTTHPELAKEWHPIKNKTLTPNDVTYGSSKKVWWLGKCKHEWVNSVANRSKGISCPYCANQKILKGFNDLMTTHPHLAKQWHLTKNVKKPSEIISNSKKKVWWQCEHGHEWKATISKRKSGQNCPYCSGNVVLSGFNDLATTHPHLAKQWHPTKNKLKASEVSFGSGKRGWWMCEYGHDWSTVIGQKTNCPYCTNKKVWSGFNDLATTHPQLLKEWHPTKNGVLTPQNVSKGMDKKVWWICEHGHEWITKVSIRTKGSNCPICNISKGEAEVIKVLKKYSVLHQPQYTIEGCRYKALLPFDCAILSNENNLIALIEYDGELHYFAVDYFGGEANLKITKKRDRIKNKYCKQNKIPLLRIPYWDFNRIEELVTIFLKQLKILN